MAIDIKTIGGLLVVTAFSCGIALNIHKKDPGSKEISELSDQVALLESDVARLSALPDLPQLEQSWQQMAALAASCGATLSHTSSGPGPLAAPAGSWPGSLAATGVRAPACAELMRSQVPVVFTAVQVSEGEAGVPGVTLSFYLLGRGSQT